MSFDSEQDPYPEEGLDPANYIAARDLPEDADLELAQQKAIADTWRLFILYYGYRGEIEAIETAFTNLVITHCTELLRLIFTRSNTDSNTSGLFYSLMTNVATEAWAKTLSFLLSFNAIFVQLLFSTLTPQDYADAEPIIRLHHRDNQYPELMLAYIRNSPEHQQSDFSWHEQLARYIQPEHICHYIPLLSYSSAIQLSEDLADQLLQDHDSLKAIVTTRSLHLVYDMIRIAIENQHNMLATALLAIAARNEQVGPIFRRAILDIRPLPPETKLVCELAGIRQELYLKQTQKYQSKPDDDMYKAKATACSTLRTNLLKIIEAYTDTTRTNRKVKSAASKTLKYIDSAPRKRHGERIFEGLPTAFMNQQREKIEKLLKPIAGPISEVSMTKKQCPKN